MEDRGFWRLVRGAPGPLAAGFGTGLAARVRPAILQALAVSPVPSARRAVELSSDFDQHLPRADHHFSLSLLGPQREFRMSQQNLQREQRRLGLAMNQPNRAAGELELIDRTFVNAKRALISPAPAVELRRRRQRQPCRIEDVGQEPDVVLGLAFGGYADQSAGDRRLVRL